MLPYIAFNAIIFSIIGGFIGKNLVQIHSLRKRIDNDSRALKKFIKELGGSATHIKIEDIDETDVPEDIRKKAEGDPKDPLDPTVIYVYN
jgi:hypothetical protein